MFSRSTLLCLILAVGPAIILAAPAPVPDTLKRSIPDRESETDAGSGMNMGIPGGPSLNLGNSYHHEYSESQPPASPQNTLVPVIVPQPPPPATTPVSNPPPQPPTSTTPEECPPEVTQVVVEEDDCDCDPAETEYQKREVGGGKGALGGGPPTRMTIPVGALDRLRNAEQGKKSGIMGGIPGGL